jgi:hypothetical protein
MFTLFFVCLFVCLLVLFCFCFCFCFCFSLFLWRIFLWTYQLLLFYHLQCQHWRSRRRLFAFFNPSHNELQPLYTGVKYIADGIFFKFSTGMRLLFEFCINSSLIFQKQANEYVYSLVVCCFFVFLCFVLFCFVLFFVSLFFVFLVFWFFGFWFLVCFLVLFVFLFCLFSCFVCFLVLFVFLFCFDLF